MIAGEVKRNLKKRMVKNFEKELRMSVSRLFTSVQAKLSVFVE